MQKIYALLMAACMCGAGDAAAADSDAATFVRLTRALEANPMQDTTKEIRSWMMEWSSETKDVSVTICLGMDLMQINDEPYTALLMLQSLFGNAAYQIEHPDKKSDQLAQQVAGVESMLKAYSSIRRAVPEKHYAVLDMLQMRHDAGQLASYLAPEVKAKCAGTGGK